MIAIGYGEKCPYCDIVMTEETDTIKHMSENHNAKFIDALFGDTLGHKQKGE